MPIQSKIPLPDPDEGLPIHTPLVYVTENPAWEYKVLTRSLDELPDGIELSALGKDGWELAGVVTFADQVFFYFKRLKQ
jgi:hypothetical protein